MATSRHLGTIERVADAGLAYVSTGNGTDRRYYPFTFDKIRRYRGQAAHEIGLRKGTAVEFSETDGRIDSVEIGTAHQR